MISFHTQWHSLVPGPELTWEHRHCDGNHTRRDTVFDVNKMSGPRKRVPPLGWGRRTNWVALPKTEEISIIGVFRDWNLKGHGICEWGGRGMCFTWEVLTLELPIKPGLFSFLLSSHTPNIVSSLGVRTPTPPCTPVTSTESSTAVLRDWGRKKRRNSLGAERDSSDALHCHPWEWEAQS
jgi:hypothetical protein